MSEQKSNLALGAARVGAVLLALGALTYFVVTAQTNAQTAAHDPAGRGAQQPDGAAPGGETYLPSSKSLVVDPDFAKSEFFLPSSKSGIVVVDPPALPDEPSEKAGAPESPQTFLPSSKGIALPPEAIKGAKQAPVPKPKPKDGAK